MNGPDAASYLNRMVSNEVEALDVGESCEALLLTPKARVIATMVVWRRGADDFLLLTEPGAGERIARELLRSRFAAKCEIALEEHRVGRRARRQNRLRRIVTSSVCRPRTTACRRSSSSTRSRRAGRRRSTRRELERLRILARTPRLGRELDDRVMPAEAGLEERAISFTKGCYPGQEPVARLHYRGHPNRGLRVLALDGGELPAYDAELSLEGKVVGRVTSAAPDPEHGVVALAYVRREVPDDATLELSDRPARQLSL